MRRPLLALLIAGALAVAGGCTATHTAPGPSRVLIIASATSTDVAPALPPEVVAALRATGADRRWEDEPAAGAALVATAADAAPRSFALVPRRADGSVERGMQRERLLDANVGAVVDAVAGLRGPGGDLDLLDAVARNARGLDGGLLVVLSHGLSTAGGLDLREVRWALDGPTVSDDLAARDLLPDLTGWDVVFVGLGATTGAQLPLDQGTYRLLVEYWTTICHRAGAASCEVEAPVWAGTPPPGTAPTTTVPVPGVDSVTAPDGTVTTTVDSDLLGFAGDSAVITAAGLAVLDGIAATIRSAGSTSVTVRGSAADPPGSTPAGTTAIATARAEAVVAALGGLGVPALSLGGAVAEGPSSVQDGRFDETRAAQMRLVTITHGS